MKYKTKPCEIEAIQWTGKNEEEILSQVENPIAYNDEVVKYITKDAFKDKKMGARPIVRYLQKEILDKLTDLLIENNYENGKTFAIEILENEINIK